MILLSQLKILLEQPETEIVITAAKDATEDAAATGAIRSALSGDYDLDFVDFELNKEQ